ncbi:GtrA family protein [Piscinibacter gummiphilus]|uniref:GtrA family protein n=1 Tax=Piscinibacter gummiphilus TaxID=946333 RepID=A0ABZ0CZ19_9BURK|nr:GtrA family protein [Piscinibacter gummiphilus]WOB10237.1 GtrA family protein [Piscinibacter gummiphilus]
MQLARHVTHWRSLGWFVAVGGAAAAVHLGVVVWLVSRHGWAPLVANVAGWCVAFCVSFFGQWRLTFRARTTPWQEAMPRFMALSLGGFALNEAAYAAFLRFSGLRYDLLLALVLVAVALITYLLSSGWAFRDRPRD